MTWRSITYEIDSIKLSPAIGFLYEAYIEEVEVDGNVCVYKGGSKLS